MDVNSGDTVCVCVCVCVCTGGIPMLITLSLCSVPGVLKTACTCTYMGGDFSCCCVTVSLQVSSRGRPYGVGPEETIG